MEEDPTDDNNINLKKAAAKLTVEAHKGVRKSWHEKTESLNFDKEGSKLWRLVKALNGDHDCKEAPVALKQDGETLTGKEAVNVLIKQYQSPVQLNFNQEKITAAEEEVQRALATTDEKELAHEVMSLPLAAQELDTALSKLKSKSTPGPDKVLNHMLCKLVIQARKKLLQLYNASWKSGHIPKMWKKAIQIPIHKSGKTRNMPESYHPISVTSCLCKWRGS